MKEFSWRTPYVRTHLYFGDATEFAEAEDASVILANFSGPVIWLEMIEAKRGHGNEGSETLKLFARKHDVKAIGLQVVPVPDRGDEESRLKVEAFYQRHGWEARRDLTPWSDYMVMVFTGRTFAGLLW